MKQRIWDADFGVHPMEARAGQIGHGSVDVIQDKASLRLIPAVNKSCLWDVYLSPTGEDSGSNGIMINTIRNLCLAACLGCVTFRRWPFVTYIVQRLAPLVVVWTCTLHQVHSRWRPKPALVSSRCDRIGPCLTSLSAHGSNASAPVWQQLP